VSSESCARSHTLQLPLRKGLPWKEEEEAAAEEEGEEEEEEGKASS
jgi:hypothetical protein